MVLPPSRDTAGSHPAPRRQNASLALLGFPLQPYSLPASHIQRTSVRFCPGGPQSIKLISHAQSVTISSFVRLQRFVDHVPVDHALHIRALDISTAGNISNTAAITQEACSDALVRILSLAPRLRTLSLHLSTELSPLAISSFSKAEQLTDLAIEPCRDAIHTSL